MKASELRIGNLYRYLHEESESIRVVDVDFLKTQQAYDEDPDDEIFCRGWWADAIPLTEEWLVKMRLEKEEDEPFNWSDKKKYLCDCFLLGYYSDGIHYVKNGVKTGIPIKYVHQLQNLYFALTGTELEIK
jgi:hypothetical protein